MINGLSEKALLCIAGVKPYLDKTNWFIARASLKYNQLKFVSFRGIKHIVEYGDTIQPVNQECEESAWEIIYLLRENDHLKDPSSMTIIQKYLLECCRRIWELIPDSGSRKGVEAAEKLCRGEISWDEAMVTDWYSEGSAFLFEYGNETDPEISEYISQINLQRTTIGNLLVPPVYMGSVDIKDLLMDAAYFANTALNYPGICYGTRKSHEQSMRDISKFLPLDLFEIMVPRELINQLSEHMPNKSINCDN